MPTQPLLAWSVLTAIIALLILAPVLLQRAYKMPRGTLKRTAAISAGCAAIVGYIALWLTMVMQGMFMGLGRNYLLVLLFFFWLFSLIACQPAEEESRQN